MSEEQEEIERRADFIIRELDEFCALANQPATVGLIRSERIAMGQILTRAEVIMSFLTSKPRLVNHG